MLSIKQVGRYFVRTTKLTECPELVGHVVYLRHVTTNGILVSPTDDCRPLAQLIKLSSNSNDDGWYDATDLILDANCAITPRYDICAFVNDIAKQYRNYITDTSIIKKCHGKDAAGRLCFIGEERDEGYVFSSTAYYVVSMDNNGYYIAYSGFCNPKKGNSKREIEQRVLRLEGTGRFFFEASSIVNSCNSEYRDDVSMKNKYMSELRDRVAISTTSTTRSSDSRAETDRLSGLQLNK